MTIRDPREDRSQTGDPAWEFILEGVQDGPISIYFTRMHLHNVESWLYNNVSSRVVDSNWATVSAQLKEADAEYKASIPPP